MARPRKKKLNRKRALAIASACVLALSGVGKLTQESVREGLDEVSSANTRYVNYLTQSSISLQILLKQVDETGRRLAALNASHAAAPAYVEIADDYVRNAQQLWADLNRNADEVAMLVESLPSASDEIRSRSEEDQQRAKTQWTALQQLLRMDRTDTQKRFDTAKELSESILGADVGSIRFGDDVMHLVDEWRSSRGRLNTVLGWTVSVFVVIGAILGVVAAFVGVEVEHGE